MKVKLLLFVLIMSLIVVGCGKKQDATTEVNEPTFSEVNTNEENKESEADGENKTQSTTENPDGNTPTDDNKTNTAEEKPVEIEKSFTEEITALVKSSDYVSLIKMTQTGSNGIEVHVMEDLKGSLKNIVLPELPGVEPNKDYLIYLRDSENGDIALTDIDKAVIYIANDENEALRITRELLTPKEKEKN